MLVMLTLALMTLTAGAAMQAREAFVIGNFRRVRLWSAISQPLLILAISAVWLLLREPNLLWWTPPTGFGIDWQCQDNVPPSVRVCFKHRRPFRWRSETASQVGSKFANKWSAALRSAVSKPSVNAANTG